MSRLHRPFVSDRFFRVTVRLLKRRRESDDADFQCLARPMRGARAVHAFFLTSCVSFPDLDTARHAICVSNANGCDGSVTFNINKLIGVVRGPESAQGA